jgi:lipopolysaccharide transport system permease protein
MTNWKRYFQLIWYKGFADLSGGASRAYIGYMWWVLEPVLYMGAFYLAFGLGLRGGGTNMVLFLLCGLVPWKWFASTVQAGAITMQANAGLMNQVYLPKFVLPWIVVLTNTVKFVIVLELLLVLAAALGEGMELPWIALPLAALVEMMLITSVASLAAAVVPLVPDLELVVSNGLIVLMFLSGIFFDVNKLPPKAAAVVRLNPMVPVIEAFRDILLRHTWPHWAVLGEVALLAVAMYALAFWLLARFDRIYPKIMTG